MTHEKPRSRYPFLIAVLALAVLGLLLQQQLELIAMDALIDYFDLVDAITGETKAPASQAAALSVGGLRTFFKVIRVILSMTVVIAIVRMTTSLIFSRALRKAGQYEIASILRTMVSIIIYIISFFMIFQSQFPNVELAALFTGSTILGIVVGLALQDTLGNLFAGIAMQADQPFQIGDVVTLASGRSGVVESITWRSVKIRAFDNRLIVIGNTVLAREPIEVAPKNNFNARYVNFNTVYVTSPAQTIHLIREVVQRTENVTPKHRPKVRIRNFGDSSIDWEVKYWLEDYSKFPDTDALVRQRIWYAFQREHIDFAYPVRRIETTEVHTHLVHEVDLDAIVNRISDVSLFAPLSEDETQALASNAIRKVYSPDEVILRRGQEGNSMFVVHRGSMRVEMKENGTVKVLRTLSEGDFFGEMGLFTGEPRAADVITIEESEVLEINQAALKPILDSNPALVDRLSEIIAERRSLLAQINSELQAQQQGQNRTNLVGAIRNFFGLK